MKDWKALEQLLSDVIERYKGMYESMHTDTTLDFHVTLTQHQVEIAAVKKWVAYLRIERVLAVKGAVEGSADPEKLLIYNQAYRFENVKERLDPATPWKYDLYEDAVYRLMVGGLEYSELLRRAQMIKKTNDGQPLAEATGAEKKLDLVITDQMPPKLSPEDEQYKAWIKNQKS